MKTIFVTGGTGFIGSEFVKEALKSGHKVLVLTRSVESANHLIQSGVEPIVGDLLVDGDWMDRVASCDWVVHLASPPTWGRKVTTKVARKYQEGHFTMTKRLFSLLHSREIEKAVFIAGTSYYGDTGKGVKVNEGFRGRPQGWGPYIAPSVEVIPSFVREGVPIVSAFPGQVYGPDSWFEQLFLKPLYAKESLTSLKGYDTMFSPIHVTDCARALLHLLEHGEAGENYFLVDHEPTPASELGKLTAKELHVEWKRREVPKWVCQLLLGPVLTEYAVADSCLSNDALLKTGFEMKYPTITEGIPDVIKQWLNNNALVSSG